MSLGLAVLLMNIYFGFIGDDVELKSVGAELGIAGVCSLIEAVSLWLVVTYVPAASRALIIPALMVALIYKVAHYEDWGRFHIFMLLAFQAAIGLLGVCLFFGRFEAALWILLGTGVVLAVIAGFAKSLWG